MSPLRSSVWAMTFGRGTARCWISGCAGITGYCGSTIPRRRAICRVMRKIAPDVGMPRSGMRSEFAPRQPRSGLIKRAKPDLRRNIAGCAGSRIGPGVLKFPPKPDRTFCEEMSYWPVIDQRPLNRIPV